MKHVPEILDLWTRLTGFDPAAREYSLGDVGVRQMSGIVRRAQELDPTDALALMLLESFVDAYLDDRTFKASAILAHLDRHFAYLRDAMELRRLLAESGMPEARDELRGQVLQALAHYGAAHREDVKALLASRDRVAFLWRDALEAADSLEAHQFMQGEPDAATPRYHGHVLSAWTLNGLLQAMVGMPSGIVMAMIRDPVAVHSYFVFGIRNGGTLTVVTDRTDWAHPFAQRLSRRPERSLSRRMERTWFPYSVLDVRANVDEEGDVVGIHVGREEGLVPREQVARRVRPVNELEPEEVVWAAMMFGLLVRRYFHEGHRLPEISYLGEQVQVASGMEVAAFNANLPVTGYEPLKVEPLRSSDLTRESVGAGAMIHEREMRRGGGNAWMEERYGHLVDDALLNRVAGPGAPKLLLGPDGKEAAPVPARSFSFDTMPKRWQFEALDASSFATQTRLRADRVFAARYNQALEIDRLAFAEYEARRDEVRAWWRDALVANKPALLAAVGKGELIGRPAVRSDPANDVEGDRDTTAEGMRGNILRVEHLDDIGDHDIFRGFRGVFLSDDDKARTSWHGDRLDGRRNPASTCAVRGVKPSWRACITPRDAGDLALMAGVAVDDLPDVLRHWSDDSLAGGSGNHILSRVDPMDWAAENPWRKIGFDVFVYLSQGAFKALAKAAGAPGIERFKD